MSNPWEISGQDIELWSQRYEASAVLPALVRRLLLATTPIGQIDLPADSGTRLGGWDGVVRAFRGSAFCPRGLSVWELSVEAGKWGKLDADYVKRTASPPGGVAPQAATYVAVTGRVLSRSDGRKQQWGPEKAAQGPWANVCLLDAHDLAAWLEQAPAVSRWFARELGRPAYDVSDLEIYLQAWRKRTRPPLPVALAVAGRQRERQAEVVRAWAQSARPIPLRVSADRREEALVFTAAALELAPEPQREAFRSRALVVESREALRWALRVGSPEPLIVLPAFDDFEPALVDRDAFAVVPLEGRAPPAATIAERPLELEAIPFRRIAELLEEAGIPREEAERKAEGSGGRLIDLQRLYGHVAPPAWARGLDRTALSAMLLIGAWQPANEADREVVRALGADPQEVEALCEALRLAPEAPMVRDVRRWERAVWTWAAPEAVWRELIGSVPAAMLKRFEEAAVAALGKEDPRYELAPERRFGAAMVGKVLLESEDLRKGLATSLARLGQQSDAVLEPLHGPGRGSALARRVVHRLLEPTWIRWASVSDLLPLLAEAAPEVFLDRLEESLHQGDAGAAHLLAEEGRFAHPHTGLLWALETLGWNESLLPQVAISMARLAAYDRSLEERPGRTSNRPAESLFQLLHYAHPQTCADAEQRLAALRAVARVERGAAFDLLLQVFQRLRGMNLFIPARRPEVATWGSIPEENLRQRAAKEAWGYVESLLGIALEDAGTDPDRWGQLVRSSRHIPDELMIRLLGALEERLAAIRDDMAVLWGALRHVLHMYAWNDAIDGAKSEREGEIRERLARLYAYFGSNQDDVSRIQWLFRREDTELPDFFAAHPRVYSTRVSAEQDSALQRLWESPGRWGHLLRLAQIADGNILGDALARAPFASEIEERVLGAEGESPSSVIPMFVAARSWRRGPALDTDWLRAALRRLMARGQTLEATRAALSLHAEPPVWDVLDEIGDPVRSEYWVRIEHVFKQDSPEAWERAIAGLVRAGNLAVATTTAEWAKDGVSIDTILQVLERLAQTPDQMQRLAAQSGGARYTIEKLFERLDAAQGLDLGRLVKLELHFLSFLADSGRSIRFFSRAMAQSPVEFVQLIRWMYRRDGEAPPSEGEPLEEERRRAQMGHMLLEAWKGYPGEGLPTEEREEQLQRWAEDVLRLTAADGHGSVGCSEVARVLARAPSGDDAHWPCLAARRLVESGEPPDLSQRLETEKWNLRGWTRRSAGEGGRQERELAATYQASALALRGEWPRTADMLERLARTYEREAQENDADSKTRLRREGYEPEDFTTPKPPSPRRMAAASMGRTVTPGIVRVGSVALDDLCCFKELRLTLPSPLEDRGQWLILLGENGSGKSTLLRALALALGGGPVANAALATYAPPLVRVGAREARSVVQLGAQPFQVAISGGLNGLEAYAEPNGDVPRPHVFGYGLRRGTALGGSEQERIDTRFSDVATLFDESARVYPALTKLTLRRRRAEQDGGAQQEIWSGIVALLCELLPEVNDVHVDPRNEVLVDAPKLGGRIPLAALSDGYLTTVGWVVDLLERWLTWAEQQGRALDREFYRNMECLVLVDEIDLNLHPRWQRKVIRQLKEALPRTSFVVTTHNPLTLLGADPGEIMVLRRSEEGAQIEVLPFDLPRGIRADQVLTGPWFGLASTVDDDTLERLELHQQMLLRGVHAEAPERMDLEAELRRRLGTYADTALDRMALEVAAELMRERKRERTPEERDALRQKLKERLRAKIGGSSGSNG